MKITKTKLHKKDYLNALKKDKETIKLILRHRHYLFPDTKEKRACFRAGYDLESKLGRRAFPCNPQIHKEWHALYPKKATENDAYYATYGAAIFHLFGRELE